LETLQKLENFEIKSKFGALKFLETVDITEENLDNFVTFTNKSVHFFRGDRPS